jgi:16S rRNA (cytidine1402-2'-O)-methyltransferase
LAQLDQTFIIYESPFRLVKTLEQLSQVCGEERKASVTREISKVHEETVRGTLAELIKHFQQTPPKGEIVICVAGKE